jgi:Fe-S-cluster containining protein
VLYGKVAGDLARRPGLFCEQSGRCCRFAAADHRLYLTRLEFSEMVAHGGHRSGGADVCPWLENGLCGIREGRALACRTYFCSDEAAAAEVTERWHAEIRRLHARHGVPYVYQSLEKHLNENPSISSEES